MVMTKRLFSYYVVLLLSCSPIVFNQESVHEEREALRGLLARAYAVLERSTAEAIPLFEEAAKLDPANVLVRRQLGYVYIAAGREQEALVQFSVADTLLPSDTTKLQIAYLLNSLGRNKESHTLFTRLKSSSDPEIREKARAASAVLASILWSASYPWWGRLYSAPYYDTRFENAVLWASLRVGYFLSSDRTVSLYGILALTRDTRSTGGAVPDIFSDNFVLMGLGLRLQPVAGLTADVQGGAAIDLIDRAHRTRGRADFRTVVSYGTGVYAPLSVPLEMQWSLKPLVETYWSLGYYSRYENAIGYGQLRVGLRTLNWKYTVLDVYLRGDIAGDTRRVFYNNVAEASVGVRLIPHHSRGLSILAEYHRGMYWDQGIPTGLLNRSYNSLRLFIVFDRPLSL